MSNEELESQSENRPLIDEEPEEVKESIEELEEIGVRIG